MNAFVKPKIHAIAKHLGISPAYVCLILKGKRPGKKYKRQINELIGRKRAA